MVRRGAVASGLVVVFCGLCWYVFVDAPEIDHHLSGAIFKNAPLQAVLHHRIPGRASSNSPAIRLLLFMSLHRATTTDEASGGQVGVNMLNGRHGGGERLFSAGERKPVWASIGRGDL